jgi:hypothetical protein
MKEIKSCLTTCGKKIRIYDVHFQYSDCRFATYWVATLEQDNYYDDNDNGFLIDGKRLCFRSERNVFYDIDMLTNGLEWLQDLRKRAEPDDSIKYRARVTPEGWMPKFGKLIEPEVSMSVSIDRLRSLVNEYASSDLSIHGPGAPILPEYNFVDFVEKTLREDSGSSRK